MKGRPDLNQPGLLMLRRQGFLRRQMPNSFASLLLRGRKVELRLESDPELRIGAKPVAEAQRRVAGDGALAGDDLAHAVGRHVDLTRELCRRDAQLLELVLEDGARMYFSLEHGSPPFSSSGSPRFLRLLVPAHRPTTRSRPSIAG